MKAKQDQHLRLPQQSAMARSEKNSQGDVTKAPDARVASQDPVLKKDQPSRRRIGLAKPKPE